MACRQLFSAQLSPKPYLGVDKQVLVSQVPDPAQCQQAVADAIDVGYRSIDTAVAYMNESAVGAAVAESGVARGELFITTKLWVQDAGYESARKAIRTSLENLGLDYLDLYLIHQPITKEPTNISMPKTMKNIPILHMSPCASPVFGFTG